MQMEPPGYKTGVPALTPPLGGVWAESRPENHSIHGFTQVVFWMAG